LLHAVALLAEKLKVAGLMLTKLYTVKRSAGVSSDSSMTLRTVTMSFWLVDTKISSTASILTRGTFHCILLQLEAVSCQRNYDSIAGGIISG
jgi:hypothetical protein